MGSTKLFTYLAIAYLPLALLDIRLPLAALDVRLSDFYLIAMSLYLVLFFKDGVQWCIHCTLSLFPLFLYLTFCAVAMGNANGLVELVQWGLVVAWVPVFSYALRHAGDREFNFLLICLFLVCAYVALAHMAIGHWTSYKFMGDAKYAFGLFALLATLAMLKYRSLLHTVMFIAAMIFLAASMERKGVFVSVVALAIGLPLIYLRCSNTAVAAVLSVIQLLVGLSGFVVYAIFVDRKADVTHFLNEDQARWESNLHRENLIANGVEIFQANPWFGVGAKNLQDHMSEFYLATNLALYTHNWYLDFFIEYGIVGALFLYFWLTVKTWGLSVNNRFAVFLIPLSIYCLIVPMFMANGTTTTVIFTSAVACFIALRWLSLKEIKPVLQSGPA